ncbi:MAG: branched-chain amino acid ABC transporter substrate-binding protein [Comamonas sp. SCN 65-56]|uniref:branched-chain amino acid ABC transporter substrate-binding protein n=1 Tax=Comamonas sp. SCN 65-56 TaxID=1660095 RepID=UPI00086F6E5B|nr:branched-chain amino acid ABC transporter substrate-binding protein [Comamonas sp. SCN 65-56]ODS93897.1 MAG: branched-chain amino acid ABC transporter substrate-binding protein [Comamonas sp. SCN 65-56]
MRRALLALAVGLWGLLGVPLSAWAARTVSVAVISAADDPRYASRRMEQGYPGQPQGRAVEGMQLAAKDAEFELGESELALSVKDVVLPTAADLPMALAELKKAEVHYLVADLPEPALRELVRTAPAVLGDVIVFNTGLAEDSLRAEACSAVLLHTFPSRQMEMDAIAQYLAARNWRKVLMLQGPRPGDALMQQAFGRSAKRYGLKIVQTKPFKLSGDPRERDLANVRLLTSDKDHDVVAVMDSDGEFARTVPYATQWPRPVVGASGLTSLAWHPQWERYGGPQLTRRFRKQFQRLMQGQDWAAWMAGKAITTVLADDPKASVAEQLRKLRGATVFLDGFKGQRLSFRPWDGQLRQPILLSDGDGVIATAPVDGVLHPKDVLDTLGVDVQESQCKQRP